MTIENCIKVVLIPLSFASQDKRRVHFWFADKSILVIWSFALLSGSLVSIRTNLNIFVFRQKTRPGFVHNIFPWLRLIEVQQVRCALIAGLVAIKGVILGMFFEDEVGLLQFGEHFGEAIGGVVRVGLSGEGDLN